MANRFPLVFNSATLKIQEIGVDDNLNLTATGIYDGAGTGTTGQFLKSTGDGVQWASVSANDTNTTYTLSAIDSTLSTEKIIRLYGSDGISNDVKLVAGTNIIISRSGNNLTISSPATVDTNTTYTIKASPITLGGASLDLDSGGYLGGITDSVNFTPGTGIVVNRLNDNNIQISVNNQVALLDAGQVLINKSISGFSNSLTNIPNSALQYSYITINGTNIPLGGSVVLTGGGEGGGGLDANTTYSIQATSITGGARFDLDAGGSGSGTDSINFIGQNGISVTRIDANNIYFGTAGGGIPNSALTNNSITINSTTVPLGGTITVGNVSGPTSATNNAIARFNATTGKIIKNSAVTIADDGRITAATVGNVIPFYFANDTEFPDPTTYRGTVALNASNGNMYFADGIWKAFSTANSNVTIGSTVIPLNTVAPSLTGLTSLSAINLSGALTGNASSATKLNTARLINGIPFDGTANITIPSALSNALTLGVGLTYDAGTTYDGTVARLLTNTDRGSQQNIFKNIGNAAGVPQFSATANNDTLSIDSGGNVSLAFDSLNKKLTIIGNVGAYNAGAGLSLIGATFANTDRGSTQNIFKRIQNSSGITQFTAANNDDALQFTGAGSTTVNFDAGNKRVIIQTDVPVTYQAGNGLSLVGNTFFNTGLVTVNASNGISATTNAGVVSLINTDKGSSQNIFKRIKDSTGLTRFSAGNNDDGITFVGAGGASIFFDQANKKITVQSANTEYTAGLGLLLTGNEFSNTGILSIVTSGTGIDATTSAGTTTLVNTGVRSLTTNTGLSVNTSATGDVSITNTGVRTLTTSTGLSVNTNATGNITVTNTDRGTSQNIFKSIDIVGAGGVTTNLPAATNTDKYTLTSTDGVTLAVNTTTKTINIGSGSINQLVAGVGIGIAATPGVAQSLTITNTDRGSSQFIFKNIQTQGAVTQFSANTNTANLQFGATGATSVLFDSTNRRITYGSINTTYSAGLGIAINGGDGQNNGGSIANTGVVSLSTPTGGGLTLGAKDVNGNIVVTFNGVRTLTTSTGLSVNNNAFGDVSITNTGTLSVAASTGLGISNTPSGNGGANYALTNTDRGSSQFIFKNIANGSGTTQFFAGTNNDTIRYAGVGGLSVSFDSTTKTITYSAASAITNMVAGAGISIGATSGVAQSITVTNTDRGSTQNIFKRVLDAAGSLFFQADSNDTGIQFAGGGATNVAFVAANKRVTISSVNTQYTAGNGINITGGAANTATGGTIVNTGVLSVTTSGTGISATTSAGVVTLANTGVRNFAISSTSLTGLSVNNNVGEVQLTFNGVSSITSGSGLTALTSATGAITLANLDRGSQQSIFKTIETINSGTNTSNGTMSANNDNATINNNQTLQFQGADGIGCSLSTAGGTRRVIITAPTQMVAQIISGTGINVTAGATPKSVTIANADRGSTQHIFKRIRAKVVGGTIDEFQAANNDDSILFDTGGVATLTTATTSGQKKIVISSPQYSVTAGSNITVTSNTAGTSFTVALPSNIGNTNTDGTAAKATQINVTESNGPTENGDRYVAFVTSGTGMKAVKSSAKHKINPSNGNMQVDGTFRAAGDVYAYSSSDARLKTNIKRIETPLQKLDKLDGVVYNWTAEASVNNENRDPNVPEIGVIAQQVKEVLPEVVMTREDDTLAVRYERLIPLLIESIKELKKEVEELKALR